MIQKSQPQFTSILPEVRPEELSAASAISTIPEIRPEELVSGEPEMESAEMLDDRGQEQKDEEENTDIYNLNNFTI
jgi:hypothetical protein